MRDTMLVWYASVIVSPTQTNSRNNSGALSNPEACKIGSPALASIRDDPHQACPESSAEGDGMPGGCMAPPEHHVLAELQVGVTLKPCQRQVGYGAPSPLEDLTKVQGVS